MEVDQEFPSGRKRAGEDDALGVQRFGVVDDAALFGQQRHDVADVFIRADDEGENHRLLDFLDVIDFRHEGRVVNCFNRSVRQNDIM